jgi:hypothetical protein
VENGAEDAGIGHAGVQHSLADGFAVHRQYFGGPYGTAKTG